MTNYNERLDEIERVTRSVLTPNSYIVPQEGMQLTRAILDWHNKQVKNAVATAEDDLDQYWNKELDKQVEEAMAKFHLKKGVKYDVKASDSVIVITHTNKLKEGDDDQL